MVYFTKNESETKKIGERFARKLKSGENVCLYGNLGSGKTTFIQGVIGFFLPKKRVLSPTFIIVRHYLIDSRVIKNLYHVDLFRIRDTNEILNLGVKDFIDKPDCLVLIEWAEKMGNLLPKSRTDIIIKINDEFTREIAINSYK